MFERDVGGNIVTKKYQGSWLIVDNGYLKWPTTDPPYKVTANEMERRWSHWLESLRKDVECTFGILKGRWRILKTGIRLGGVEIADQVWRTCCALHNWLLEIDGLDGDWEGQIGLHDTRDVMQHLPFAVQRLHDGWDPRTFDASGLGPGDDRINRELSMEANNNTDDDDTGRADVKIVRHLTLNNFRGRLIEHFDIMFKRNQLVWPQRMSID